MYSSLKNTLVSSFCSTLFFLYLQLPSLINNDNKNAEVFSSLKISAKNAAENKKSKRLYNSILQFIDIYLSLTDCAICSFMRGRTRAFKNDLGFRYWIRKTGQGDFFFFWAYLNVPTPNFFLTYSTQQQHTQTGTHLFNSGPTQQKNHRMSYTHPLNWVYLLLQLEYSCNTNTTTTDNRQLHKRGYWHTPHILGTTTTINTDTLKNTRGDILWWHT